VAGLCWRAGLRQASANLEVQLLTSPAFRELVLFTPPHRQAVALEPYTCATDAINLQQRGSDAGLQVLQPGQEWRGVVELALHAGAS
jgi:aldose 1-epimerase